MKKSSQDQIKHKEKIVAIVHIFLPQAKVYLFGSFARGDNIRGSDIDIAIDAGEKIPLLVLSQIDSMVDVLNLHQRADISDFNRLPKAIQDDVLNEGIEWTKKN